MPNFNSGWHLIYTRPKQEKKVHSRLVQCGINALLPTRKVIRQLHDKRKCVQEPLFPSYIFVYHESIQNYYDTMDADGFLYYVRSGKQIARVSDVVIDNIRLVTENGTDFEVSENFVSPGMKVVISQGALAGLTCEVVQLSGNHRLLVRVDLLKRNILLTMDVDMFIPATTVPGSNWQSLARSENQKMKQTAS